jgi:23S rRNA pseudouridine1911/1915/1917 synthase
MEETLRLVLGTDAAGQRLDRALADRLPEHSRTRIASWIAQGRVRVDGARRAARDRVAGGETVEVDVPPAEPLRVEAEPIPLAVLYEDEHLVVVDKPAGLVVHPGSGRRGGTLANALAHHAGPLPQVQGEDRPGIVHRLDKDTSGVLVAAKREGAQRALSAAFAAREVEKAYVAVVHGVPAHASGTVEEPLGRSPSHRTKMAVRPGGRAAVTRWEVERALPRHAVLRCRPVTGRTHQIRVHLLALGHPIVGDPLYGRKGAPGEDLAPRLLLHAEWIAFDHPVTGERLALAAPRPPDLLAAIDALAALPPRRRG